jgi:cytochrome d ubiquinol oxidase subunit I
MSTRRHEHNGQYSRFVGDVFGAPLAMEGLAAFFLKSTFLGLWLFGWDRLPKRVHLACIWMMAVGSMLSALFILAANSWMQHPVGYTMSKQGVPQLNNIWALFTNPSTNCKSSIRSSTGRGTTSPTCSSSTGRCG